MSVRKAILDTAIVAIAIGVATFGTTHSAPVPAQAQERPVCTLEDGSDVAPEQLPCVWVSPDDGRQWLTFADHSVPITVAHGVAAADGAVPGP